VDKGQPLAHRRPERGRQHPRQRAPAPCAVSPAATSLVRRGRWSWALPHRYPRFRPRRRASESRAGPRWVPCQPEPDVSRGGAANDPGSAAPW